jgi:hypothetical protein
MRSGLFNESEINKTNVRALIPSLDTDEMNAYALMYLSGPAFGHGQ